MVFIRKCFICFPQFVFASILYLGHRFLIQQSPVYRTSFFRGFFPDFLALLVCIPVFASSQKIFNLRKRNKIYFIEIVLYWILFSVYFEIIGPNFIKSFTGDLWDILAYFLGGITLYISNLWTINYNSYNVGNIFHGTS